MQRTIRVSPQRKIALAAAGRGIRIQHAPALLLDHTTANLFQEALTDLIEEVEDLPEEPGGQAESPLSISYSGHGKLRLETPGDYWLTPEQADDAQASVCEILESLRISFDPLARYR